MKNDYDLIHLPELSLTYSSLKKYLKNLYNLNLKTDKMGFFSFKTSDTKKTIYNDSSRRGPSPSPVYMITEDGRSWREDSYGGYGEFGGKDIFELIAEMNGGKTRDDAWSIVFTQGIERNGKKYYQGMYPGADFMNYQNDKIKAEGLTANELREKYGWKNFGGGMDFAEAAEEGFKLPKLVEHLPNKADWDKVWKKLPYPKHAPNQGLADGGSVGDDEYPDFIDSEAAKHGTRVRRKRPLYAIMMGKYSQMDNPQYVEVSGEDMDEAMAKFKAEGVDANPANIHFSKQPPYYYSGGGYAANGKSVRDLDQEEDDEFAGAVPIEHVPSIKSTTLYFQEGTSDKEYHIQLRELMPGRFIVNFQYGRRGGPLQSGTKTTTPVSLQEAEMIFEKLKHEKERKGYHEGMAGGGKISDLDSTTQSLINEIIDYLEKEFGGKVTASRMTGSMKNYIKFSKRGGSFYDFNEQWTKNPKYNKILQDKFGYDVFMSNSSINIELLGYVRKDQFASIKVAADGSGVGLSRDIYSIGDEVVYGWNGRYYKIGKINSRVDENTYSILENNGNKITLNRRDFDLAPSSIDDYAKTLGFYANGGGIPNNYKGKNAHQVWDALNKKQRHHFLFDHEEDIVARLTERNDKSVEEVIELQNKSYMNLPEAVKDIIAVHIVSGQYTNGGGVEFDIYDFDKKMALINLDMIYEYSVKLDDIVTEESSIEEWIKMKLTKVEQNIADIKHSLSGWEKFEKGGMIFKKQLLHISKYAKDLINMINSGSKLMSWQENKLAISADYIDGIYHHLDYIRKTNLDKLDEYLGIYANGGGVGKIEVGDAFQPSGLPYSLIVQSINKGIAELHRTFYNLKTDSSTLGFKEFSLTVSEIQRLVDGKEWRKVNVKLQDNSQLKYANGGGIGKEYKLRAEGLNDFINFLGTGIYFDIKWFKVETTSGPDVIVTFSTNLSLKQIKSNLEQVQDSHVMLDTLKPVNEYTGERMADGGGVESKYYVMDAKSGEVVSKGFDTEEESKVEMYRMFEETGNRFLIQKTMANGGGVSDKVYIDFLNKDKRHQQDRKYFDTYEKAVKWARANFERFHPDMIKYVSYAADGAEVGTKWTYEIKVFNDPKYYGHGRTWDTKEEAEQAGKEKLNNWMNAEDFRVVQATEEAARGKVVPGKVGYFVQLQQDTPNQVRYLQIGINTEGSFTGMAYDYVGGGAYETQWLLNNYSVDDEGVMEPEEQEAAVAECLTEKYGKDFSDKVMTGINKMFAELFTYEDNGNLTTSLSDFAANGVTSEYASFPRVTIGNTIFSSVYNNSGMAKQGKKVAAKSRNEKVYLALLEEAREEKAWAEKMSKDKEWMSSASNVSKDMVAEALDKSAEELANTSYNYLEYRAHMTDKTGYHTDKPSKEKWEKLSGRKIASDGMFMEGEFDKIVADLKKYLSTVPYIWTKGNKSYVPIEGWQYAAALMGMNSRVVDIKPVTEKQGWMATAEVVNQEGIVVCTGFGYVDRSETKWSKASEYELISFAQTRAVSRALRNCISYLIKAAGYSTTPAEEMYGLSDVKKSSPNLSKASPIRPIIGVDDTYGYSRPEYTEPVQPPIVKVEKKDPAKFEVMLTEVWAEAKGTNIVLVSPKFMTEVEESLMTGLSELSYETMLREILDWLIDNNIILRSKPFMKKIKQSFTENK